MKKIYFLAAVAACALSANAQHTLESVYADATLTSEKQIYDVVVADGGTIDGLKMAGQKVNDVRPNGDNLNLYVWDNTFVAGDGSYPGVGYSDMQFDGYTALEVGTLGWSGAGFHIQPAGPQDFSHWSDETRLHIAYRSTNAPASIAFIICNTEEAGKTAAVGNFAIGDAFNDNGTIMAAVGPKATEEWQALDISFADIKKVRPTFNPNASANWCGNLVAFLAGGVTGTNLSLDAIYFHTPAAGNAVKGIDSDSAIVATRSTVNAQGAIAVYDLRGRKVASGFNTVGIDTLPAGLYIAKCGNQTLKVVK